METEYIGRKHQQKHKLVVKNMATSCGNDDSLSDVINPASAKMAAAEIQVANSSNLAKIERYSTKFLSKSPKL